MHDVRCRRSRTRERPVGEVVPIDRPGRSNRSPDSWGGERCRQTGDAARAADEGGVDRRGDRRPSAVGFSDPSPIAIGRLAWLVQDRRCRSPSTLQSLGDSLPLQRVDETGSVADEQHLAGCRSWCRRRPASASHRVVEGPSRTPIRALRSARDARGTRRVVAGPVPMLAV